MRAVLFAACMAVMCGGSGLVFWATALRTTRTTRPYPNPTKGTR